MEKEGSLISLELKTPIVKIHNPTTTITKPHLISSHLTMMFPICYNQHKNELFYKTECSHYVCLECLQIDIMKDLHHQHLSCPHEDDGQCCNKNLDLREIAKHIKKVLESRGIVANLNKSLEKLTMWILHSNPYTCNNQRKREIHFEDDKITNPNPWAFCECGNCKEENRLYIVFECGLLETSSEDEDSSEDESSDEELVTQEPILYECQKEEHDDYIDLHRPQKRVKFVK